MYRRFIFSCLALMLTLFVGCADKGFGDVSEVSLDYSDDELWFEYVGEVGRQVDVFYILPTCVWDWTDDDGVVQHYADPYNESQRADMLPSYEFAADIFASEYNYYAPYYRQISLDSWIEGDSIVELRFPEAMADISSAFDYFLENKNQGRPFVLAGFSQGGKCVIELLKSMPDSVYSRMVAAYAIGYKVSESDLTRYSTIVAASSATDTGVVISYNSVADESGLSSQLSPSEVCINPLNWCVDATVAMVQDSVSVYVNQSNHALYVEGLDSDIYYIPTLKELLPKGNYHLQELTLYQESLTQNVKDRVAAFGL